MNNKSASFAHKNYFYSELKTLSIDDRYHTWWITGTILITSNTNLPNYSYYFDVRSEIGEFNNIPLYWSQTLNTRVNGNNTVAYKVDEFRFKFSFNFAQSSLFSEFLKYREYQLHFYPMFNQNVIQDFQVDATTQDIQEFIKEMNQDTNIRMVKYSNQLDLINGVNNMKLNTLDDKSQLNLKTYVGQPTTTKPYVDILEFQDLTEPFNLLKAEFKLACGESQMEFNLPSTLYTGSSALLSIPYQIYLNDKDNFVINNATEVAGLFSAKAQTIVLTGQMKFEYQKVIRTVNLTQNITFNQQSISAMYAKLNIEKINAFQGYYTELENEKIF